MLEGLGNGLCQTDYLARPAAVIFVSCCNRCIMPKQRPLILLLEDDAASAEALQLMLRDWGADVIHGLNADEVSAAAGERASQADIIIADFHLGAGRDGVTMASQLRQSALGARVLVLSGSTNDDAQCAAARASYTFMRKPALPRDIIAWLDAG